MFQDCALSGSTWTEPDLFEQDAGFALPGRESGEGASAGKGFDPFDAPAQRRREPRFSAADTLLWLQWWQDGEYLGRPARLINVSRNGAMIVAWVLLEERQRLRVYLEDAPQPSVVEATVLGVVEATKGMHQIRLEFLSPCADAFIKAAAEGFESWLAGTRPSR